MLNNETVSKKHDNHTGRTRNLNFQPKKKGGKSLRENHENTEHELLLY